MKKFQSMTANPLRVPPLLLSFLAATVLGCSQQQAEQRATQAAQTGFSLVSVNVAQGDVWQTTRPIDLTFSADVDFATVNTNTIRIHSIGTAQASEPGSPADLSGGIPAPGAFELVDARTVRFRPACPTGATSQPGLLPGGREYRLLVPGAGSGRPTVRSTAARALDSGASIGFYTTRSADPAEHLFDPVDGAPTPLVRAAGSSDEHAAYLELGADANRRVYFERDPQTDVVTTPPTFQAPLNFYSDVDSRVAWVLAFDQPIAVDAQNLSHEQIGLEYQELDSTWTTLPREVEVMENCTELGARLRVTPLGLLPQGANVRAFIETGFRDLAGQATLARLDDFAPTIAQTTFIPGTMLHGDSADEVLERFVVDGNDADSLADTSVELEGVPAHWSSGKLTASSGFVGTGGPGGSFDWVIPSGVTFLLDTVSAEIISTQGVAQTVVGGVVDVRNFTVQSNAKLIIVGPNPFTLLASQDVVIEGEVSVDGFNSPGVGTLNTTHLPEVGAAGQGGGGRGGIGSFLTAQSTPFGGPGFGAFGKPGAGGQGGETSYAPAIKNDRRGAGGGGGRFAADVFAPLPAGSGMDTDGDGLIRAQGLIGLDAEPGFAGGPGGLGAISQSQRAAGGAVGPAPFTDGDASNDFFGRLRTLSGEAIVGELSQPWAGAGGGAGGDAVRSDSFPLEPFSMTGDEKGAGGGGGAGSLRIIALGSIYVGSEGTLHADGGHGGGGENTNFFDRVGGGSGGGSGGHIILESAAHIEIAGASPNAGDFYDDGPGGHAARPIRAVGGQGGAGRDNRGGATQDGETLWLCDAIPFDVFEGTQAPPFNETCFQTHPDFNDPEGPVVGAGGDGSPGLIQLHVPDPATDIILSGIGDGDATKVFSPPPVGWDVGGFGAQLVPSVSAKSYAQSKWLALGGAHRDPLGNDEPARYFFEGTNSAGKVRRTAAQRALLAPPILGPETIGGSPTLPFIDTDGLTLVFDAAGLSGFDEVYLRNTALLRDHTLILSQAGGSLEKRYTVTSAEFEPLAFRLRVTVSSATGLLTDFNPGGALEVTLIPRFFRVETNGIEDYYPTGTEARITFDATRIDADGRPDPAATYSELNGGWTADLTDFNSSIWGFVRFRVEFDLDAERTGIDPTLLDFGLTHLRLPFRF